MWSLFDPVVKSFARIGISSTTNPNDEYQNGEETTEEEPSDQEDPIINQLTLDLEEPENNHQEDENPPLLIQEEQSEDLSEFESEEDEEDVPGGGGFEVFEGTGQITNLAQGMQDGLVDNLYKFNQHKFSNQSPFYLHDRVWIKAQKHPTALDWRVLEMKLDKEPKVQEMEARQKFALTHRKVRSVTLTEIELEPLETLQGTAVERIKNTLMDIKLIPGDWLDVRTEVTNSEQGTSRYALGKMTLSLTERDEVRGKLSSMSWDGESLSGVIDGCYLVPSFLMVSSPDLHEGSLVRATTFRSEQKDFNFRAITITEDTTAVGNVEKEKLALLCSDKREMRVTPGHVMDFGKLRMGSTRETLFHLTNTHPLHTHCLRSVMMQERGQTGAKFTLNHHQESDEIVAMFPPDQPHGFEVKIKCEPLMIGRTDDLCIFNFGEFVIIKRVCVHVIPDESQSGLIEDLTVNRVSVRNHQKLTSAGEKEKERRHLPFEDPGRETVFAGVKQIRSAFFKADVERIGKYPIPEGVKEAVKAKESKILWKHFPTLSATPEELKEARVRVITPDNYSDMLHVGLWMEELHHLTQRQTENLENVILTKSGDCHFFEFPKLQDVYPKFQINDPIQFLDPLDPTGKLYRANITRLGPSTIFLQLNPDFPPGYTGKPLSVEFLLGRRSYKRNHHAVNKVMGNWGAGWLFPTEVNCLESRITFIDEETDGKKDDELESDSLALLFTRKAPKVKRRNFVGGIPAGGIRQPNITQEFMDKARQSRGIGIGSGEGDPESPASLNMKLKWCNRALNEEQKSAIRMILRGQARPCPYIIFGPPGTGKTVTVVEAVIQIFLLDPHSKILVCGPSNASANQISSYLIEFGKFEPGEFVRLLGWTSAEATVPELLVNYVHDGQSIKNAYMSRIIVTTCNSAAQFLETFGIEHDMFSHVFIDEAGYCHEPDSLIPISLLTKNNQPPQVILAGDPNQLGPVLFDDISAFHGLSISLLERLMENPLYRRGEDGKYPGILITKLIRNYRAHRDLLYLPSTLFYDNELMPASTDNLEELSLRLPFLPKPGFPLLFHGVRGEECKDSDSPSWYNPTEVLEVIRYVKLLLTHNCVSDDIGIITPYRKQVEKIKQGLSREVKCRPIRVGSVEEFQGGEKKIIILSLVRSLKIADENEALLRLTFAFDPKRFNVSITRAKCLLISIGNPHVFETEKVWRELLMYAIKKEVYIGCDLPLDLQRFTPIGKSIHKSNPNYNPPNRTEEETDSDSDDE